MWDPSHQICSPPLMEDADHDEKGCIETIGNWKKQYFRGEKVVHMTNEFHKWVSFLGPWKEVNQFETQGGIRVGRKCGN
jgi:Fe-S oxidoreductase